ncbi:lipopolysaccharide biosynthesis protein [Alicyclobacillus kakegawensis]|uniref:lipopolysaccharide biosynthesis protein n=1 Tax=Alicyclobacillus kakegawensis TaxID=392012 RepID=UPI000833E175|nr:oligosaccharide flippase family protein [Alicyclobacillus kakegawensis]
MHMRTSSLTARTFVYKLTVSGLAFAGSVLTARALGKAERGDFQLTTTIVLLGQTWMNGFAAYQAQGLAKQRDSRLAFVQAANPPMLLLPLYVACMLSVALALVPGPLPQSVGWAAPALAFSAVVGYSNSLLQGVSSLTRLNRMNSAQPLGFLLLYALALASPGAHAHALPLTYAAWLASWAAAALIGLQAAYRQMGPGAWRWRISRSHIRSLIRFGAWQSSANLVNYANYRADFWMVIALAGPSAAADYGIALTAGEVLLQVSTSLVQVMYQRLAGLDRADAVAAAETSCRHTLLAAGAAALGLAAVYPWFIPAVFGARYEDAILPALLLLPGLVGKAASNVIVQFAVHQLGRPQTAVWMNLLSLLTNLACCGLWIPVTGLPGAACASTLSYLLALGVCVLWFGRVNQSNPRHLYRITAADIAPYLHLLQQVRKSSDPRS